MQRYVTMRARLAAERGAGVAASHHLLIKECMKEIDYAPAREWGGGWGLGAPGRHPPRVKKGPPTLCRADDDPAGGSKSEKNADFTYVLS